MHCLHSHVLRAVNVLSAHQWCFALRAVPSNKRASEVEGYGEQAEAAGMLEDGDNDGWVAPAPMARSGGEAEEITSLAEQEGHAHDGRADAGGEAEEDIPDIDELELEDRDDEDDEVCGGYQ